MKVLIITAFPPMKAPEADHGFLLCQHLADRGLDVHVVTAKGSIAASHPRITVHPIMRDWSWSDLPRLAKSIQGCSPDSILLVYVGWIYNDHLMITFAPTISKYLLPRTPFITLFEDADNYALPWQTSLFGRAVLKIIKQWRGPRNLDYRFGALFRDSDRIIAVSDRVKSKLAMLFPGLNGKGVVIPSPPLLRMCPEDNGATRRRMRETLGADLKHFIAAYFGYIYPSKGVETLLKAFHLVTCRRSNVRLIMVGGSIDLPQRPCYTQELHEMARRLSIDDKVIWTGGYKWDSDEPSRYLRAADACILPFDHGVCVHNSSFAAAAVHGLPIITTRDNVLEEPFVDQQNVLLCPPKDPEALAAAVEKLMDNPHLCKSLRRNVLNLAQEWFSWDRAIERTIATLL